MFAAGLDDAVHDGVDADQSDRSRRSERILKPAQTSAINRRVAHDAGPDIEVIHQSLSNSLLDNPGAIDHVPISLANRQGVVIAFLAVVDVTLCQLPRDYPVFPVPCGNQDGYM